MVVPFARELAKLVPPIAVRLRRDFGAVLTLIRAHALLHRASRPRDAEGEIVATIEDFAVVRGLVADLLAEGVEATVPATVRETVEAVSRLAADAENGVSLGRLAGELGIDKSAASRRWQAARRRGYLENQETRRGRPARLATADPLPSDVAVLPTTEELERCCSVAGVPEGTEAPPPPEDVDEDGNVEATLEEALLRDDELVLGLLRDEILAPPLCTWPAHREAGLDWVGDGRSYCGVCHPKARPERGRS